MDVVSQVLTARSQDLGGIERMVGASVLLHAAAVAVVMMVPSMWLGTHEAEPEAVMTISLGGPPGPRTSTSILGGRPVQTVATEPLKAIEPVRPPAAQAPEMIEPMKK